MADEQKVYPLARRDGGAVSLMPQNLEEAYRLATRLANSGLVPRDMSGNPDSVLAAMLLANELGVGPMAGLTNIAVVNGRAYVWGELLTGLVWQSGLCEKLDVALVGSGDTLKAVATGKRKGTEQEVVREFTYKQALAAGLVGAKVDPRSAWAKYPEDMLQHRAKNRLINFLWPDVVKGLRMRELQKDDKDEVSLERETAIEVEVDTDKGKVATTPPTPTQIETSAQPEAPVAEEPKPEPKPEPKADVPKEIPVNPSTSGMIRGILMRITYKTKDAGYIYSAIFAVGGEEQKYIIKGKNIDPTYSDKELAKRFKDMYTSKALDIRVNENDEITYYKEV